MSDRRVTTPQTAGRDMLRDHAERIGRLEVALRSLQQGLTSAGTKQLLANGKLEIEVTSSGVGEGLTVTFRNTVTGSVSTIDLP